MFARHRQDRTFLPADEHCPLCPSRPGRPPTEIPLPAFGVVVFGVVAFGVVVFENRFPALVRDPPTPSVPGSDLYPVAPAAGANEVVVYSDDHDLSLAQLGVGRIAAVVDVWTDRYQELGRRPEVAYVFVFENRGVAVGVTIHHPHGQIYGYPDIPPRPRRELDMAIAHMEAHGTCVYCDVVERELASAVRVVASNAHFAAFVPFAARFPYEIHLAAIRHVPNLTHLDTAERAALAEILGRVLLGYDALFGFPLPYVMSMHQEPTDGGDHAAVSHLHLELTPLHRTAERLKYLAGSELGAGAFVNDTAPEETAERLRAVVPGAVPPT